MSKLAQDVQFLAVAPAAYNGLIELKAASAAGAQATPDMSSSARKSALGHSHRSLTVGFLAAPTTTGHPLAHPLPPVGNQPQSKAPWLQTSLASADALSTANRPMAAFGIKQHCVAYHSSGAVGSPLTPC